MTRRARPAPKRVEPKPKREKIGKTPLDPTRPIGKNNPPIETQFTEGNRASVGYGRPRKLKEFQELILDTLAEELAANGRMLGTRAQAMIRLGLNKNPIPFLEYVFGKVPQPTREMNADEWREWCIANSLDPDKLIDEFTSFMGSRVNSAGSDAETRRE